MSFSGFLRLGPNKYRECFGLSFEDLKEGLRIHHRPGADVSQEDNRLDAVDLINNAQLHFDSNYASRSEWKKPLGVSTMTLQRLLGMISRSWYRRRRLLGLDSVAMTKPVFGGDTLYATSTVIALNSGTDPDVGQVSLLIEGTNQRGEVWSKVQCRLEVYRAGKHPEDGHGLEPADEPRFRAYHDTPDGALMEQSGLFYEDIVPGETFVHWPGRTLDAVEARLHALRALEINPRWSDDAYLRKYPQFAPAVFEPLVIGTVTALTTRTLGRVVCNLGWTAIDLPRPVRPGETIYAESTFGPCRLSKSRPTQGIVKVETRAYVESGELICRYERALLIYRRGQGPYQAAGY
jgi:itaconyl-CoA hydratase